MRPSFKFYEKKGGGGKQYFETSTNVQKLRLETFFSEQIFFDVSIPGKGTARQPDLTSYFRFGQDANLQAHFNDFLIGYLRGKIIMNAVLKMQTIIIFS